MQYMHVFNVPRRHSASCRKSSSSVVVSVESLDYIAEMTDAINAFSSSFLRAHYGCEERRLVLLEAGGTPSLTKMYR